LYLFIRKAIKKTSDYRGIIFLSTMYKIFYNILLSRLTPYAEEITGDHQCVFRCNRSIIDHIFYIPFFLLWRCDPTRVIASSFLRFSRSHTTTHHSQYDSSGRVISSLQRPLPDNTQHSQQTNIHAPVGFEPTISAGERPQTYILNREATGTGAFIKYKACSSESGTDKFMQRFV
jgi:hypothetical protein